MKAITSTLIVVLALIIHSAVEARYYDARTGRYLTSDPVGVEAGVNTYAYAAMNPLRYVDPMGLDINVCHYPGPLPHVGFGFKSENITWGYRPLISGMPVGPGQVSEDSSTASRECKTVPSTEDQDKCMMNCRLTRRDNPGIYHVGSNQCTSFVRDCMRECNIPTGIDPGGDTWQGPRPDRFYDALPGIPYR